ncbi:MAG: leucine-rich repeat domain-containing protein [Treponema sp.]|nr:leucine-rich repeat domain-containing protein [Treponema sp.]
MGKKIILAVFLAVFLLGVNSFAQNAADFTVTFTEHFDGVKITGYTGSVRAVTIPAAIEGLAVTEISNNAFANRNITSVVVPSSVTIIGDGAFSNCSQLTSITLHDNITSIGINAFRRTAITTIRLPARITIISQGAFAECRNLTSIVIPEGVTIIGQEAFTTNVALTSITFPSTLRAIHNSAFLNCTLLSSITIPDSVTNIEFRGNPFVGCNALPMVTQAALRRRGWNPNASNAR